MTTFACASCNTGTYCFYWVQSVSGGAAAERVASQEAHSSTPCSSLLHRDFHILLRACGILQTNLTFTVQAGQGGTSSVLYYKTHTHFIQLQQ